MCYSASIATVSATITRLVTDTISATVAIAALVQALAAIAPDGTRDHPGTARRAWHSWWRRKKLANAARHRHKRHAAGHPSTALTLTQTNLYIHFECLHSTGSPQYSLSLSFPCVGGSRRCLCSGAVQTSICTKSLLTCVLAFSFVCVCMCVYVCVFARCSPAACLYLLLAATRRRYATSRHFLVRRLLLGCSLVSCDVATTCEQRLARSRRRPATAPYRPPQDAY